LSKAKIKKYTPIQLKAGYKDDYGIIFYGTVDEVWDEWQRGDVKTVVQASVQRSSSSGDRTWSEPTLPERQ
jgi:hypothetical protein